MKEVKNDDYVLADQHDNLVCYCNKLDRKEVKYAYYWLHFYRAWFVLHNQKLRRIRELKVATRGLYFSSREKQPP